MTGGGNVRNSDSLEEKQWMKGGEIKLFGNVSSVRLRLRGKPRERKLKPALAGKSLEMLNIVEIGRSLHKHKGWDELRVRLCRFFLGLLIELVSDKGGDDHLAEILSLGPNTRLGRNTRILGLRPILRQAERPKEAQFDSTLEHQTPA
jgi:hypothetical protein